MQTKHRLELIGITYNQIESGVYAMVLQQVGSNRRIPIIIGFPEAQAIECKLQEIKTLRPWTHDIMINTLKSFGIRLDSVTIKQLPNGVFAADLNFTDGQRSFEIDARSSDAVALAIRCDAPIYATDEVIREAGFDPDEIKKDKTQDVKEEYTSQSSLSRLESMTLDQLSQEMMKASEAEDYEKAAEIKALIDSRQNNEPSS